MFEDQAYSFLWAFLLVTVSLRRVSHALRPASYERQTRYPFQRHNTDRLWLAHQTLNETRVPLAAKRFHTKSEARDRSNTSHRFPACIGTFALRFRSAFVAGHYLTTHKDRPT